MHCQNCIKFNSDHIHTDQIGRGLCMESLEEVTASTKACGGLMAFMFVEDNGELDFDEEDEVYEETKEEPKPYVYDGIGQEED